jgi:hypothetical protein
MAEGQWIYLAEAEAMFRERLKVSAGKARKMVREAIDSDEILFRWVPVNPGDTLCEKTYNRNDFVYWLDQLAPPPAGDKLKKPRTTVKQDRARDAIGALWPNGVPDQRLLPNKLLCAEVMDWLKADSERNALSFFPISDDVILVAAGRKSK